MKGHKLLQMDSNQMNAHIISWNARDINAVNKMDHLKDLIQKYKRIAMVIQETKMIKVSNWLMKHLWGNERNG